MDNKNIERKNILNRLRRIEGQIKGVERMIENDACCRDILVQVAAVRSGMNKVGSLILKNYAQNCMDCDEANPSFESKIEELVSTLDMFLK